MSKCSRAKDPVSCRRQFNRPTTGRVVRRRVRPAASYGAGRTRLPTTPRTVQTLFKPKKPKLDYNSRFDPVKGARLLYSRPRKLLEQAMARASGKNFKKEVFLLLGKLDLVHGWQSLQSIWVFSRYMTKLKQERDRDLSLGLVREAAAADRAYKLVKRMRDFASNIHTNVDMEISDKNPKLYKLYMSVIKLGRAWKKLIRARNSVLERLEKFRKKKIRLSKVKARALREKFETLNGTINLVLSVPEGDFAFADAREWSIQARTQIVRGVLTNNSRLTRAGLRLRKALQKAAVKDVKLQALYQSYVTKYFPPALWYVIRNSPGFPVLSDSYSGYQIRGGPRPNVIEKYPIVKFFKKFKDQNPHKAAEVVRLLNILIKVKRTEHDSADGFMNSFAKWDREFKEALKEAEKPKGAFVQFFSGLNTYMMKQMPKHQRYLTVIGHLDRLIGRLRGATDQTVDDDEFRALSSQMYDWVDVVGGGFGSYFLSDEGGDVDVADMLQNYVDRDYGAYMRINNVDDLRMYAHWLRGWALRRLKPAIDAHLAQMRGLPYRMEDMYSIRQYRNDLLRTEAPSYFSRNQLADMMFHRLEYTQAEAASYGMLNGLLTYQQAERNIYKCAGGNFMWRHLICKPARWFAGSPVYVDSFGNMIERVGAVRAQITDANPIERWRGVANLQTILEGSMWPDIERYGKDSVSTFKFGVLGGTALQFVSYWLPIRGLPVLARLGTIARLTRNAETVVQLARVQRIASIMEVGTMTVATGIMDAGYENNIWLGYNADKGEWGWDHAAVTLSRIADNAKFIPACLLSGMAYKWMSRTVKFASKGGILPAVFRAAVAAGVFYGGLTAGSFGVNLFKDGAKNGFTNLVTSTDGIVRAAGRTFTAKEMMKNALLTVMANVGGMIALRFRRANSWVFKTGPYKAYIRKVDIAMGNIMTELQTGDPRKVLKALSSLETEMAGMASLMGSAGLDKTEQYQMVLRSIDRARKYYYVFSPSYGAAGVRGSGGYYTYAKGRQKQLREGLRGLGAGNTKPAGDGTINATIDGKLVTFKPREPIKMSDGPWKAIDALWARMTPGQKTFAWLALFPAAVKLGISNPEVFGAMGLFGLGAWQQYRATKAAKPK